VVAIGCLLRDDRGLQVRCIGQAGDSEARLLQQFYRLIEHYTPQLVSWNGAGFDLQVMHYRALIHGVPAGRYWEQGDEDREFRYNNYLSRYHARHLDLMDLLALYTARANAPLDDLARLCGFPGKLGMDGSQVWPAYQAGQIDAIRAYCETDVANTWLLFCRFQQMRGLWQPERYDQEVALTRSTLQALADAGAAHWSEYLVAWDRP
jgi:predicted PolB exonuclease-like 3'-5' exonuclease